MRIPRTANPGGGGKQPGDALVRQALAGETQAFEELNAHYKGKIYSRAFSIMRNEGDGLAFSQQAWDATSGRLDKLAGTCRFSTWMTRIVINECLDELRKRKPDRSE